MTELKRWERLRELALAHKAWIRTADDAVTDDGRRVSPYPELAEILADYERLREALEKYGEHVGWCTSRWSSEDIPKQCNCGLDDTISGLTPAAPSATTSSEIVAARKSEESSSGGRK